MCVALPARVLDVEGGHAIVELGGRRRRASLLLEPGVDVGAWVLVGAGTVLRRIDPEEARDLARRLEAALSAALADCPGGPR